MNGELLAEIEALRRENAALREQVCPGRNGDGSVCDVLTPDSSDAFLVIDTETGIVTGLNKKAEKLFGWPMSKLMGMHIRDLHKDDTSTLTPNEKTAKNEIIINIKNSSRNIYKKNVTIQPIKLKHKTKNISHYRDVDYEKNREFYKLFELSNDIFCVTDIKSYFFIWVNQPFTRILGYSLDEVEGKSYLDFLHPDDRERTVAVIEEKIKVGEDVVNLQNRHLCKNGSYKWLQWVSHTEPHKGKNYAMARDITKTKITEEALRASKERYSALYKAISKGMAIQELVYDSNGIPFDYRILDVNERYEAIFGISRSKAIGALATELYNTEEPPYINELLKVAKTAQPLSFQTCFEPRKTHFYVTVIPIKQDTFATIFEDLTDFLRTRKELEKSLRDLSNTRILLKEIFQQAPIPMAVVYPDITLGPVNTAARKMFGIPNDTSLSGKNLLEVPRTWKAYDASGKNIPKEQNPLLLGLRGRSFRGDEIRVELDDGSECWGVVYSSPIYNEHNELIAAFSSFPNITEYKKALKLVEERSTSLEKANAKLAALNLQLTAKDRERDKAQRELQESESRFRALFENSHAVMLIITPETGEIVNANPAAAKFYGYSQKKLKSMRIMDINTLSAEEILAELKNAQNNVRTYFILKHRLADGRIRDVEVFSGSVESQGKTLVYSIIHDITERIQAKKELLRYSRIIASTPDMISLVDRNYHYSMVNDAYLKTFGKKRKDIVGKHLRNLLGDELFENSSKPNLDLAFFGKTTSAESSLVIPGKGLCHFNVTYHPVPDKDGSIPYVAINAHDISERKRNEEAVKSLANRLTLATDAGDIGIWEWDIRTGKLQWEDKMLRLYEVEPGQFSGMYDAWRTRIHPEDVAEVERHLFDALESKKPFLHNFRIVLPDGRTRHINASGQILTDENGEPRRMIGINRDITEQMLMELELRRLATTDALTGANNLRYFLQHAEEELIRARRYNTPLTLITLDVDHFKAINDSYGHHIGDEVLKKLVSTCRKVLRTTDIFARIGGEEFSVLFVQTGITAARATAERLRTSIGSGSYRTNDQVISFTISIGLSELRNGDKTIKDIMHRADKALYRAKKAGRNRLELA